MGSARVGHLATASREAEPHVIPVCFVLDGDTVWSVIDEKPKSGPRLRRLRNIDETGRAALLVDHYDDDWTHLAWILVRGHAITETVSPDVLSLLRDKYPQYNDMYLNDAEVIKLSIDHWTSWRGDS